MVELIEKKVVRKKAIRKKTVAKKKTTTKKISSSDPVAAFGTFEASYDALLEAISATGAAAETLALAATTAKAKEKAKLDKLMLRLNAAIEKASGAKSPKAKANARVKVTALRKEMAESRKALSEINSLALAGRKKSKIVPALSKTISTFEKQVAAPRKKRKVRKKRAVAAA